MIEVTDKIYKSYNDSLLSIVYGYVLEIRNIIRNIKFSMQSDDFVHKCTKSSYIHAIHAYTFDFPISNSSNGLMV